KLQFAIHERGKSLAVEGGAKQADQWMVEVLKLQPELELEVNLQLRRQTDVFRVYDKLLQQGIQVVRWILLVLLEILEEEREYVFHELLDVREHLLDPVLRIFRLTLVEAGDDRVGPCEISIKVRHEGAERDIEPAVIHGREAIAGK